MPKRFGNLFQHVCTLDALYAAYLKARKGKRTTLSVLAFEKNLGAELQLLLKELQGNTYKPRPYRYFWIHEPKPRRIAAPAFRDVVVQHAIYKVIYPIFDTTFIHDSYGCRVGKGTHKAADKAQQFLRQSSEDSYILQLDIRKFYYSINRTVLREQLKAKIKDRKMVQLMYMFVTGEDTTGVPIGNLLSQLYALVYLNPLDHYIKRTLKCKRYVRYVDDFIIFGISKAVAVALKDCIELWLRQYLCLSLSRYTIQTVKCGVNFVGFRTYQRTRIVRKHSLYSFSKALKKNSTASVVSIIGNAKRSASYYHFGARLIEEYPVVVRSLPKGVQHDVLQVYQSSRRRTKWKGLEYCIA